MRRGIRYSDGSLFAWVSHPRVAPMVQLFGVALTGTGSCLPARPVSNDDLAAAFDLDTSDEWIRTRTGIRSRRFAAPGETSASLGAAAARTALAAAGLAPTDLDLIVCATVTPDLMCPANACLIQAALGCRPVAAFDVSAACSGFVYALSAATQFVRTGAARHALVVGAEVLSRAVNLTDRNSCILFGDGAGAAVLSATPDAGTGVRSVRLYADGSGQELIRVPSKVSPAVLPGTAAPLGRDFIHLNGREVYRFAVTRMIELIRLAEADCRELGVPGIDLLVPHQVNQRIIDAALADTGFPADRVVVNLDRYGNTSAASVPIALDEAIRTGRCNRGDTVLLVAFGGGLTWSSALVTL
ncbi:3-oxoacyl-acp synthase : 3-oxoacyl-[acyl-carrier-protein] synthase 3 OS=Caldalkalibacillus thermarum TA2.A1 GN=fabH PE=3 SV=1: ACP_syn_III: ACP_syn_III_C [Gemmataceae bacterium]|nr:3-oxoacyl-acp synthase : 3-oxoacyl-[acyl-carrier-protein] synthase 3 OS=Caldalkalibacillus thermarum TA2.A1 GN=fabH PE=3 SV=1: ACP_syn_III: ACP_syn_III_C [Gemmataceae bacterium]VTT97319.1 3-oxoacyl-acp synthase : 3-oxoacyl-[acyl-carrier-protein] synthase 3 OS=Caldalkalibacillus thermarum TA2.A1 GN=fabH PE=3 SV=1: ACP_syn_III: ACP_syn_III_C [Gemmataceae bacterium]